MKKTLLSILILTSAVFAQAQTKSVTLDLLGSSGIAGVSFDSRFKGNHGFGYNVGLSYAYGTGTISSYSVNGIGIPLEINYLFGQKNSHLVLGLGMTNGIYKYSAKSFLIGDDAVEVKPEDISGTAWGTTSSATWDTVSRRRKVSHSVQASSQHSHLTMER